MNSGVRIAVLVASHNRVNTTVRCLKHLYAQELPFGVKLDTYLVDDASDDGTPSTVRDLFPEVKLLAGTGKLYWGGAMRAATDAARKEFYEYFLWLNDDVLLFEGAIAAMMGVAERFADQAVVVGGLVGDDGSTSYGGLKQRPEGPRLKVSLVAPGGSDQEIDTMNGNVVLLPGRIFEKLGGLDPKFTHNMADFDFGYRTRDNGHRLILAPDHVGSCSSNKDKAAWLDPKTPLTKRLRMAVSKKGLPPGEWVHFCKRYGGGFWPRYFIGPYFRCAAARQIEAMKLRLFESDS